MSAGRVWAALKARPLAEVWGYARILARHRFGFANRLHTADRQILEQVILPHYATRASALSVLFVGCDWYTGHYQQLLPARDYITIDPDPWKQRFGSSRHIVAGLQTLADHVEPASLDLVVCNGVFGWGLDERADCERAFAACYEALRPGGEMVIGWNDIPARRPLALASLESIGRFRPLRFEPLGTTVYRTGSDNEHLFEFYARP